MILVTKINTVFFFIFEECGNYMNQIIAKPKIESSAIVWATMRETFHLQVESYTVILQHLPLEAS